MFVHAVEICTVSDNNVVRDFVPATLFRSVIVWTLEYANELHVDGIRQRRIVREHIAVASFRQFGAHLLTFLDLGLRPFLAAPCVDTGNLDYADSAALRCHQSLA